MNSANMAASILASLIVAVLVKVLSILLSVDFWHMLTLTTLGYAMTAIRGDRK